MNSETLTPAEAAARAGVSRPTISRALKSGELIGIRDNSARWRVRPDDLAAWIAGRASVHPEGTRTVHAQSDDVSSAQLEQARAALTDALDLLRIETARAAAAEARAEGLADRLADAQKDRDAWRDQANKAMDRPGLLARLFRPLYQP